MQYVIIEILHFSAFFCKKVFAIAIVSRILGGIVHGSGVIQPKYMVVHLNCIFEDTSL